jgi:hypothetical protein
MPTLGDSAWELSQCKWKQRQKVRRVRTYLDGVIGSCGHTSLAFLEYECLQLDWLLFWPLAFWRSLIQKSLWKDVFGLHWKSCSQKVSQCSSVEEQSPGLHSNSLHAYSTTYKVREERSNRWLTNHWNFSSISKSFQA